jgi:hypothetical protein
MGSLRQSLAQLQVTPSLGLATKKPSKAWKD